MLALSHSDYSLRSSSIKIKKLVSRAKELGFTHLALTDYGMSGCVELYEACIAAEITPVMGFKIQITRGPSIEHGKCDTLILLAKNREGWLRLLEIIRESYREENYDKKNGVPHLELNSIYDLYDGNFYILDGYFDSVFFNTVGLVVDKEKHLVIESYYKNMSDIFGSDYVIVNDDITEEDKAFNTLLEDEGITVNKVVNPYYLEEKDAEDHYIFLSLKYNMNIPTCKKFPECQRFFNHHEYYLKESGLNLEFESYNILGPPKIPRFTCPDGLSEEEYLVKLAREGWSRIKDNLAADKKVYGDRVKAEMEVFLEFGLSGYMLITWDWINWAKDKGILIGHGRGSVVGSLVAYLLRIIEVDPIKYNLFFERFMNKGRMSKDHISLPDIDTDVPPQHRPEIIEYLQNKYGTECISHIATFSKLQGKAALKAVLKAHSACPLQQMDHISKLITDENKINDELAEGDIKSALLYSIINNKELHEYVQYSEGKFYGEYAKYFEQALRIEGCYQSMGVHAAGVIICGEPISNIAPIAISNQGEYIVALDKVDAEKIGLVKFDILVTDVLIKLMYINELLRGKGK